MAAGCSDTAHRSLHAHPQSNPKITVDRSSETTGKYSQTILLQNITDGPTYSKPFELNKKTDNSTVSCVVMPCSSENSRRFRGTSCLPFQDRRVNRAGSQQKQETSSAHRGNGSGCFAVGSLRRSVSPWYRNLFELLTRL
jgi:hypothetical protein